MQQYYQTNHDELLFLWDMTKVLVLDKLGQQIASWIFNSSFLICWRIALIHERMVSFLMQFVFSCRIQDMQSMHFDHEKRIVLLQSREIFDNIVFAIRHNLYACWRVHLALRNLLQVFWWSHRNDPDVISESLTKSCFPREQRCVPNIFWEFF